MVMHRISPYGKGSSREWLLTMGKFCKSNDYLLLLLIAELTFFFIYISVGTGVILATAFVHMLPEALENFGSHCLSPGWQSYGAFAGVFCMISSFALQLLELAAISNIERLRAKNQSIDIEKRQPSDTSLDSNSTAHNAPANETCIDHGHVHSAGLFEEGDAFKHVGTLILELGIVMHSIIIGITLSNTGTEEFITLLIALVFHQVRYINLI
jgi:hypothetical protein